MKVFVTGASGNVGSEVVKALVANEHEVVGLVRSEVSAQKVKALGASIVMGDLEDYDVIVDGAKNADGFIHLGFSHDFTKFTESVQIERTIIEKVCDAYQNTNKPFISTSGTLSQAKSDFLLPSFNLRVKNEGLTLSYGSKGVRAIVIRLAPTTHSTTSKGFMEMISEISKAQGSAYYPGDGQNVWPSVATADSAQMYVLALEKGIPGTGYNVASELVTSKEMAEAIGKKFGISVESIAAEKLPEKLGPIFGNLFRIDNPLPLEEVKSQLGWTQKGEGLIEEFLAK